MKYQILVENGDKETYTATVVGLPDCRVQASSRGAAVADVQRALEARLAHAEVVRLDVAGPVSPEEYPVEEHPWLGHVGSLKDNPLFDEVQAHIADYRRELDADPNVV